MNRPTEPSLHDQATPVAHRPRRRVWLWSIVIALLAVGGYFAYRQFALAPDAPSTTAAGRPGGAGGPPRTPIVAEPARTADVDVYLNALGTVTPLRTVTVRSRVDGQLLRVLFEEGQIVKEGELLAEIDPRPFQVQLTQAEGQMARDQALLENAQLDLERYRTLFEQDSIAKQQVDTQAALVRQYEGAVKVDQAQIDNARLQLTYARITAPISGPARPAAGRPGQHRARRRRERPRRDHAAAADRGGLHRSRRTTCRRCMKRLRRGEKLAGRGLGPRAEGPARDRHARHGRQPDRPDHRHGQAQGAVREQPAASSFPNQFVNVRMLLDTSATRR